MANYNTSIDFNSTTKDLGITIPVASAEVQTFVISLLNNGAPIDISSSTVKVICTRPDSFNINIIPIIINSGTINVVMSNAALKISGKELISISIYNTEGTRIYTGILTFMVDGTSNYNTQKIPDSVGYSVIEDLTGKINNLSIRTSEFIIAPHDSTQKLASKVLLDDNDNSDDINNAIDMLARGGTIKFLDGTINLKDSTKSILLKNNITIDGLGAATMLKVANNAIAISQFDKTAVLYNTMIRNILIVGDKDTVVGSTVVGIKLSPQELILENVKVIKCRDGINLDGGYGASIMNYVSKCVIGANSHRGLVLGSDSNVTQCLIGDNGMPGIDVIEYDSCALNVTGWGNNIENNHLYKSAIALRVDWSVGNMIIGNMFESGYYNDIMFAGRAHMNTVKHNTFMGKDRNYTAEDNTGTNCIEFIGAPTGEGAKRNSIDSNDFTFYSEQYFDRIRYNYAIAECENCDNNSIRNNNIFREVIKQTNPILKIGAHTVATNNVII